METCEIVDSVKISGGEPLFNPKFSHFLEHLLTKKIPLKRIHLTTNGTIYKDEIIEQLNKINEVIHLKLSVEATGRQEEFIRWPTVWQEKEQNIRKFIKNTRQDCSVFEISTCVQSLTLLTIFKVEKFVENLKAEFPDKRINFNKQPVGKGDISSSVHSDNEYLLYCKNFATLDVEKYINSALDFKDKKTRAQVLYYLDLAKIQGVNFAELFPIYWRYHKKYVE